MNHMLTAWWSQSKGISLSSWLCRIVPCIVLGNIWKGRNGDRYGDRYGDTAMNAYAIISNVRNEVNAIYTSFKLKLKRGRTSIACSSFFSLSASPSRETITLVRWKQPHAPWTKLNSNGARKGNPGHAGVGGVFRRNAFILAYSEYLGIKTSVYAEACSIMIGI